ncbi:MAG: ubiquinol-cytochrome c reductase iron-sulfur subunit [Planctomycetota bacterium]
MSDESSAPVKATTPPPAWPSPWPYDFPVEDGSKTAKQVERLAPKDGRAPMKVTRRGIFSTAFHAWAAFATAGGVGTLAAVRFLFPNVSFEPPQKFVTAPPSAFGAETVDETWKESNGVWMVNTGGKIIALSTVCTHLGCTPNWLPGDAKYKCPCHGSGYYIDGVNFEGPTPRPLERFRVSLDPVTGKVLVDKTAKCQVEQGTCDAPQFYLPA